MSGSTRPKEIPLLRPAQTASTNRLLKERVADFPRGAVCYTDHQTAGRGRLGRSWETPPGTALALSVLWYPEGDVSMLPLVCGWGATRAIEEVAGLSAYIKWPNDSICNNRKVCGILCESGTHNGRLYVVAGVGVNLTQTEEDFARADLPYAGSILSLTGKRVSADEMAEVLLTHLQEGYARWQAGDMAGLLEEIKTRCITLGRPVQVLATEPFTGMAVDLDATGRLVVEREDGSRVAVNAGEVSVRGLYGYT